MRVAIAGHTGAIGRALTPLLKATGHEVIGLSKSTGVDLLDAGSVARAVNAARPDAVVHMATAIPAKLNPRKLARDFTLTNRLRTEGTANLYAAAAKAGVTRVIAQGLAYGYEPGAEPANEDTPFWADAPAQFAPNLVALRELEDRTSALGGLVLRFGHLHGPGTVYAPDGSTTADVRAGKMPLVGDAASVFSFTHVHDAATAVVAALDKPVAGALNIVDDHPLAMATWLPAFAQALGAPAPKRLPAWLARLAVGPFGVAWMTALRGADNARARLALDWRPRFAEFTATADTVAA